MSQEPVYTVAVGLVFIQGAGPRTTEDRLKAWTEKRVEGQQPVTTVSVLPPGRFRSHRWSRRI